MAIGKSVLNRTHRTASGEQKRKTFVIDFVNKPEQIRAAFEPYFTNATLETETDPYVVFHLATKLAQIPFFTLNGFGGDTRVPFLPTNAARLDGVYKLDARLTKNLPLTERYRLMLNFEAFNVTNTPYDTSIGSGASHNAYSAANLILTPVAGYGVGTQSAGFPDGTNVRRAQIRLRFAF